MNILLTGNKGFIGSHLQRKLEEDHDIYGLDEGLSYSEWTAGWHALCEKITYQSENTDMIVHCGAVAHTAAHGDHLWQMNCFTTRHLAEWAKSLRIPFIFISSYAVAGRHLRTPYALSKWTTEQELELIFGLESPLYLIVRLPSVWSENEPDVDSDVRNPSILNKLIRGCLPVVYRNCYRDFVYISECVDHLNQIVNNFEEVWRDCAWNVHKKISGGRVVDIESFVKAVYDDDLTIFKARHQLLDRPDHVPYRLKNHSGQQHVSSEVDAYLPQIQKWLAENMAKV